MDTNVLMYMNLNKGKTNDTYTYFYEVVGVNCDFVILVNKLKFNCIILNRYILLNIFLIWNVSSALCS